MGNPNTQESTPIFEKPLTPIAMGFKEVLVTAHKFELSETFSARILEDFIQSWGFQFAPA